MKIRLLEIGDSKAKTDSVTLWDKTHSKYIILQYSFEELESLLVKEVSK